MIRRALLVLLLVAAASSPACLVGSDASAPTSRSRVEAVRVRGDGSWWPCWAADYPCSVGES